MLDQLMPDHAPLDYVGRHRLREELDDDRPTDIIFTGGVLETTWTWEPEAADSSLPLREVNHHCGYD